MNRRAFFRGLFSAAAATTVLRSWWPSAIPSAKVFEQVHVAASCRVWVQLHDYWNALHRGAQAEAIGHVICLADAPEMELGAHVAFGDTYGGRVVRVERS